MHDPTKLAFIDTETCGLDPDRNPIWDVAVIVDDVEHQWFQRLPLHRFNPHDGRARWAPLGADPRDGIALVPWENGINTDRPRPHLDQWVLDNTGLVERYNHADALDTEHSTARFAELTDGRHLVGAVPSFDEERLRAQYRRWIEPRSTNMPWHYHLICVEALAAGFLAGRYQGDELALPWDSEALSAQLGVNAPTADRHTALGDARWAKAIYEAIVEG